MTATPPGRQHRPVPDAAFGPSLKHASGQLLSTFGPYFVLIAIMYAIVGVAPWLTLALATPAAMLIVRIFIIQHDCGHGSFFRARGANDLLGRVCSVITLTPYGNWRRQHAVHHAMWNNLDRRGPNADIYSTCATVREYLALTPFRRHIYRLVRHPVIAQLLVPPFVFLILYRVPFDTPRAWLAERRSVWRTDAALAILFGIQVALFGLWPVVLVQLPAVVIASIAGVWLFSVQHRFEDAWWARQDRWNAADAAIRGSSHLRLPRVLQWFSGNIGFHHLHHLAPRVPNYRLQKWHESEPELSGTATSLTFREALLAPLYALWDEDSGRMVRFADAAQRAS